MKHFLYIALLCLSLAIFLRNCLLIPIAQDLDNQEPDFRRPRCIFCPRFVPCNLFCIRGYVCRLRERTCFTCPRPYCARIFTPFDEPGAGIDVADEGN